MLQVSTRLSTLIHGVRSTGVQRTFVSAAVVGSLAFAAACDRNATTVTMTTPNGSRLELPNGVEPVSFSTDVIEIHNDGQIHSLLAEVAETPAQRERGLMYRTEMPDEAGMIFAYPEEQEGGFWMRNTRIPLSIAYADQDGVIFQITDMLPCESLYASLCPSYPSSRPFRYALEVNQSYFRNRGIGSGGRIVQRQERGTQQDLSPGPEVEGGADDDSA